MPSLFANEVVYVPCDTDRLPNAPTTNMTKAESSDVALSEQLASTSNMGKRVLVMGLGNGGCRAIDYLHAQQMQHVRLVKVDMDEDSLAGDTATILLSVDGNGAGMKPEVAVERVNERQDEILPELEAADVIILLTSLGGGTGTGALPEIAALAKNINKYVIAIFNTPEEDKGPKQKEKSDYAIKRLLDEDSVNAYMIIPNQRLMEDDENATEEEAHDKSFKIMYQAVLSFEVLTVKNNAQKIDFKDICTILEDRGKAFFATERYRSESNENLLDKAIEALSANSLAEIGQLKSASGVLLNVCLANPITVKQKTQVNKKLLQLCPSGNSKLNSTVDPDLDNHEVILTIIATQVESDVMIDKQQIDMQTIANEVEKPQKQRQINPQMTWHMQADMQTMELNGVEDLPAMLRVARN